MQVFNYSGPEFNPYDEDRQTADREPGPWAAPAASGPLSAELTLPGSKSLTNRELVLSALADAPSTLRAPLRSRDSSLMIEALRSLGTRVEEIGDGEFGPDLRITPGELSGGASIDCGLAGTVMRFLPPVAALALGPVSFDGDEGARRRPMRTTIDSLRALGVDVSDDGRGRLPFNLYGTGQVAGGELAIDASASSQFVSGLLLAAPRFTGGLDLRHMGAVLPSLPHIEMTIAALRARGVNVHTPEPGHWIVEPGPVAGIEARIEPDLSNAAPFLISAIVAGGTVRISGWPESTTQVGADLERLLPLWGAVVTRSAGSLLIDGGAGAVGGVKLPGVDLDLSTGGELAPAIVALMALAEGPSRIIGIGHLRGHETDRLAALAANLTALGGSVRELDDGLEIEPRPLVAGPWKAWDDHRMAHAGAIIGLAVPGILIDDIGSTAKTMPEFPQLWLRTVDAAPSSTDDPLSIF
ncbi:MAG: aroA [Microbacteriaceae bacterium]|jgi:3-phosphoshikimate 1-carboxyvinyltransferase|nr:aroA [Microbacteriaceae bacterium]HEV7957630.1 3-phosphoshikimate 1-carboxyvinyltransferase [Marisediminicola sp.]